MIIILASRDPPLPGEDVQLLPVQVVPGYLPTVQSLPYLPGILQGQQKVRPTADYSEIFERLYRCYNEIIANHVDNNTKIMMISL